MPDPNERHAYIEDISGELQDEGLKSEKERLAIGFLFSRPRDNPELIDLQVASRFLSEIQQEEQTA